MGKAPLFPFSLARMAISLSYLTEPGNRLWSFFLPLFPLSGLIFSHPFWLGKPFNLHPDDAISICVASYCVGERSRGAPRFFFCRRRSRALIVFLLHKTESATTTPFLLSSPYFLVTPGIRLISSVFVF